MAGTKKKDKPVKRKANKPAKRDIVRTLDGWSLGDFAWAKSANNETIHGTIVSLHAADQVMNGKSHGYAATLMTIPDYKYRVALLSSLTEEKPKGARVRRAKKK